MSVKGFIPNNPNTGDPNSFFMKSWFKQVRDFCYGAFGVSAVSTADFALRDAAFYPVDTTAGNITASLPPAVGIPGKKYTVKKYAGGNNVIVDADGTDTVEGAATYTISTLGSSVCFVSDGNANWYIESVGGSGGLFTSPLTTKGDIYGYSTVDARVPVGANTTVLTADSAQALGIKWAAVPTQVAGSDTQIQFNDGGVFGAESDFTWDKTTNTLTLGQASRMSSDTSNATQSNRFWFYNSVVNGNTNFGIHPNGTATTALFRAVSNSTVTAALNVGSFGQTGSVTVIDANVLNGGTQGTMELRIGGAAAITLGTDKSATFADQIIVPKTTNYGIKVDTASPTFGYRDIIGDLTVRTAGANDPNWATYRGVLKAWEFSASVEKEIFLVYHVPHDYVPGTDIYFHMHWSNAAAVPNTGNVVWGFDYSYAKGYNQAQFPAASTVTVTQASHATQYEHQIAETAAVTIAGMEVDGLILCRVYRKAADAADTCTDAVFGFTADIHYQSTNLGTKAKNGPAFYT